MMGTKRCLSACNDYLKPCLEQKQQPTTPDGGGGGGGSDELVVSLLLDLDPNEVLHCVATSIDEHGFWNEHLVPWMQFVSVPLNDQDIQVAVFPMDQMGTLMRVFGVVDDERSNNNNNNKHRALGDDVAVEDHGKTKTIMGGGGRGGLHVNKFDDHKSMSYQAEPYRYLVYKMQEMVAKDRLSDKVQSLVCRLYQVDVDVMRYLTFPLDHCSEQKQQ
jgi:hypothetical protein